MDILRDKDIVCVGYNQTMVKIFLNNVLPRKGLKPISDVEKHLGRYWVKVAKTNRSKGGLYGRIIKVPIQ